MSETPEPTREQLECFIESGAENDGDVYQLAVWRLALEALDRRAEFASLTAKVAEQQREINALCDGLRNEVQRCQSTYAAQAEEREKFKAAEVKVAEQAAEIAEVKDELANVLNDWNALVKAVAAPTHGGAIGHAKHLVAQISRQAAEIERLTDCPMILCPYEDSAKTAEAKLRAVEALCMSSIATNATLIPSDAQEGGNFDGEDAMAHRVLAILEAKG